MILINCVCFLKNQVLSPSQRYHGPSERTLIVNPHVSIVTPVFNAASTISQTIDSIIAQRFSDWELLLIDDASSDNSRLVAECFTQTDSRIKYFRLAENGGPAIARNTGIEHAKGSLIAFLDADDLWHPEKLERQIAFMEKERVALSCTSYSIIDEQGRPQKKDVVARKTLDYGTMLTRNYIGCLTAMYDTRIAGKTFMPNIRKRQDYGLWLNIIKRTGPAAGLQECLAYYRNRPSSLSSNKLGMIQYNWRLMRDIEGLSYPASAWYLSRQIANRIFQ